MQIRSVLPSRVAICLALACGLVVGANHPLRAAPPKKKPPGTPPIAAGGPALSPGGMPILPGRSPIALPGAANGSRRDSVDVDEILPTDNDRRMSVLADLHAKLGPAKRETTEALARLEQEQQKLAAILGQLAVAEGEALTLSMTLPQNANELANKNAALAVVAQRVQALKAESAAARRAVDVAARDFQAKAEALEKLRVRWFRLTDFFARLPREDHNRSIATFDAWLQAAPDDQAVHLARSVAYWNVGWLDKALEDLNPLIEAAGPGLSDCLAFQGLVLCQSKRDREGIASIAQAIKLDKSCVAAYVYRAQINLLHDRCDNAMRDLRLAQKIDPGHPEPQRLMALLQATCDKPPFKRDAAGALANAERARDLTKGRDWRSLEALAASYGENGKFDEASRTIDTAARLCSDANRARCENWKTQFEAHQPIRLSPRECAGIAGI